MSSEFILPKDKPRQAIADRLRGFVLGLPMDKAWKFECNEYRPTRSNQQNAALWGHAYKVFAAFVGLQGKDEIESLHIRLCEMYFGTVTKDILGESRTFPKRTTTHDENGKAKKLSTVEFMDFYSFVQRVATENGCFITDPDPEWFTREAA